ncbi:hypothetical protein BEP19_02740 [Ammoniphilus oxalaticus]|uniref:Dipeptidylpeptidase IV N-terminal domain-containing protein n=1 Tax=Ammoniphilus oxalaticus TaxID=66863 RepID=A0A419SNJ5_9BACL|nr:hypothetical protein [Ammoniphilus oxalaticus]RKD25866.1 hypothetical protein BEP19_02740 [Ammoniphilus oxalaticus]
MKKGRLFWIGAFVVLMIVALLLMNGLTLGKGGSPKSYEGLTGHYDVSSEGMIAYVFEGLDGKHGLYVTDAKQSTGLKLLELESDKALLDPTFSADGSTLFYISINQDLEAKLHSSVHQIDLETKRDRLLFSASAAITEIECSPNGNSLFFLQADVFQNYSPIASKRPHDYDVYEYNFGQDRQIQHTNLKQYSMDSLVVAEDAQSVFVQMGDVAETAEEIFDVKYRIFQFPLDQPSDYRVVSDPDRLVDIYTFDVVSGEDEIIFQSISNPDAGATYQYELYRYNRNTNEEQQLTVLKAFATNPLVGPDQQIYFMLDRRFPEEVSDYHLYRMNGDGSGLREVELLSQ